MSQACKICNHPKRLQIDRELVQGKSVAKVSQKYHVPYDSLYNHAQNHLSHQLRTAYEKKAALEGLDLLSEIEELIRRSKRIMDQAESENKLNTALNAIGQARGSYELLSKIAFSLHQARLAELELEREKSGATNAEEIEELSREYMDRLTDREAELLLRLIDKANGETNEFIEPGQYLPRLDDLEPMIARTFKHGDPRDDDLEDDEGDSSDFSEELQPEPEPKKSGTIRRNKAKKRNEVKPVPSSKQEELEEPGWE